jgi:iron-sulfur cluster repair protein YtfE (RIC family)
MVPLSSKKQFESEETNWPQRIIIHHAFTMENQKLLDLLLAQHHQLREDLTAIDNELPREIPDFQNIFSKLSQYKNNLAGHLQTEDQSFYPLLLKQLEKNQLAIENTKRFIDEMTTIGAHIQVFFERYPSPEQIASGFPDFIHDFQSMSREILLRISTEEDGVYTYIHLL